MSRSVAPSVGSNLLLLAVLTLCQWSCGGEAAQGEPASGGRTAKSTGGNKASGGSSMTTTIATGGRSIATGGTTPVGKGGNASGGTNAIAGAGFAGTSIAGSAGAAGSLEVAGSGSCVCGDTDCGICPPDRSVAIPTQPDGQGYRIDATEVTNRDYAAFLAAKPTSTGQPNGCAWNGSFVPPNSWPAVGLDDYPVVWVDWCDAYSYCKWARKRLCGQIGGGALPYERNRNPDASQWYRACSNNGALAYPYGGTYDAERCNGKDRTASESAALAVASQPGCEGGVPGLFDMSGNVWEWEDSCASESGATDSCRLRGGSFWSETSLMDCPTATESYTRASINKNIGFRCCSATQ